MWPSTLGCGKVKQYDLVWEDVKYEIKECTARDTKNGTSRQVHAPPRKW